jgi:hypothetical protein
MGLIGGIARTAVAAGTWTAVSNRVSRRQADRWARQDQQQYYQQPMAPPPQQQYYQQPPVPAPAAAAPQGIDQDRIARLKDLANLKAQGVLTEEEFAVEKARILA